MKKLLAMSGLGSSMAFWAISLVAPHIVLILVVLTLNAVNPIGGGVVSFTTSSSTLAGIVLSFTRDFFEAGAGKISNTQFIVGL